MDIKDVKIGMRVRCVAPFMRNQRIVNELGTVMGVGHSFVLVSFDNLIDGHTCGGHCLGGHGWGVPADRLELALELVKPTPKPKILTAWVIVGPKKKIDEFMWSLCASRNDAIEAFLEDVQAPRLGVCTWPAYYKRGYRAVKVEWKAL